MGGRHSSEGLAKAEEEVEVVCASNCWRSGWIGVVVYHRIDGRVEVVREVEANGAGGGVIAEACADGVGEVVEAALAEPTDRGDGAGRGQIGMSGDGGVFAGASIGLPDVEEAFPRGPGIGKDVAHVVEEDDADGVADAGKCGRRQAKLGAVDERASTADGVAGLRIAGPGGVDGEAAQGSSSAGVEALRQGNELADGVSKGAFLAVPGVAGEDIASLVEAVIAGVGKVEPVELDLRAEGLGGEELLEAGVCAAMGVEGRVAGVADPCERGAADADGGGQKLDLAWRDLKRGVLDLYAAEVELVDKGVGF